MKEYLWCTPEIMGDPYQQRGNSQFIFLKLREVQDNVVHVIIQHTADHKRYDDSRKCMTSVLGDKAIEEYWIRNEFPSQAFFLKINCWLFNNYSPKWRWHVVNVYQPVKQRGKQMRLTHLTITCIYIRRK